MLDRLSGLMQGQDPRRLLVLAVATATAFVAVLGLARMAAAPQLDLLFAGLDPAAAGEVVAALDARGVAYEVRGDSIHVDGARRDPLRLELAAEGLPRTDGSGYEILDTLGGFGTTAQMFDAAYWRAREGELTRTILAGAGVRAARVHIANPDPSPFARDRRATASVTVQMRSGPVGPSLARAVQSLVAGATRGLTPDDVTVIDAATGRVVGGTPVDHAAEARDSRAAQMRSAVENILAARLGPGRFVVEVALDTSRETETITERRLDPETRVVVSTETEERASDDRGGAGQGVTVASNLPDGDVGGGGERSSSATETRERVNYDVSALERQLARAPGAIERVTVAVLVDGLRETGADGAASWAPRPPDELETLRELVQSAVGFREARGDVVTVRSMELTPPPELPVPPALSLPWLSGGQVAQMAMAGLLALLALAIMILVIRPALRRSEARASGTATPAPPEAQLPAAAAAPGLPAPPTQADADGAPAALADLADLEDLSDLDALPSPIAGSGEDDPVERLRHLISERREETLEVLRGWMDEPEGETAS